jgi:hypothetical protein
MASPPFVSLLVVDRMDPRTNPGRFAPSDFKQVGSSCLNGIQFRLRFEHSSWAHDKGVPWKVIAALMGHHRGTMTDKMSPPPASDVGQGGAGSVVEPKSGAQRDTGA